MKNLKFLAMAAFGLSMLAGVALANDENDYQGKGGKQGGPGNGAAVKGGNGPHYSAPSSSGGTRVYSGGAHGQPQAIYNGGHTYGVHNYSGATTPQTQHVQSGFNTAIVKGSNPAVSKQYNQSNNYGGRWSPADTHPNWNQNQQYYWNNHHYGWFNGGWLIIDNGFWPYGYPYPAWYNPNPIYYSGNSMVANVQGALANMGYYGGPVDGQFGPMTSAAIRHYQIDTGLPVTGRINPPLLNSLGVD